MRPTTGAAQTWSFAWLLLFCLAPAARTLGEEEPPFVRCVPPWFSDCVAYHNAFEGSLDQADVNTEQIPVVRDARRGEVDAKLAPVVTPEHGLFGQGLFVQDWRAPFMVRSPALSPHRPLTLSFWWALPQDLKVDGGYMLFEYTGGGYIGLFCRGKGEWCALQRPAGVFQIYYFPGIQNVNGIYDYDLLAHQDLRAGVWHHSAVVSRQARTAQVYTDGKLVFEVTTSGRDFTEQDALQSLAFGGPLYMDELLILNRAVEGDMIADYVQGIERLREYQ